MTAPCDCGRCEACQWAVRHAGAYADLLRLRAAEELIREGFTWEEVKELLP